MYVCTRSAFPSVRSNTVDAGIPGVALTLLQKDPAKTVVVTVGRDDEDLVSRIDTFIASYNDLVKFADAQAAASASGTAGALGRDTVLRGLRQALRGTLLGAHGSGVYTRLAEIGIGFTRTGELTLNRAALTEALTADATAVRAAQLGIKIVSQGGADKLAEYERILADAGLSDTQVGYMGDDLQDLPVLRRAGFSAAPADAAPEVRAAVQWVSPSGGGRGAARECIEHVLRAQGHWQSAIAGFFDC